MKPTTTPNGATLIWLEAGDALMPNDVYESLKGNAFSVQPDDDGTFGPGYVVNAEEVSLFRPRRYIPKEES